MASDDSRRLRITIVEVLYALTIAEVATRIARLVADGHTPLTAPAAFAHLTLAMCLVTTSWVDWPQSKAPGNVAPVDGVFSWGFVILLVDVIIVIFYFILAQGVDPSTGGSAANETLWTLLVFGAYVLWDVLTNTVSPAGRFWARGRISLACTLVAALIWYGLRGVTGDAAVVLTDAALIALVFLFRALKQGLRRTSAVLGLVLALCVAAAFGVSTGPGR